MRIGFDRTFAEINQAGTGIYVDSLARALVNRADNDTVRFFSAGQFRDLSKPKTLRTRMDTLYRDLIWMHLILPIQARKTYIDLLHMPANLCPIYSPCPVVLTILDTIIYQNPNNFPLWQRNYFLALGPHSARNAAHIITISESSKADIVKTFGISPEKITSIPIAVSPEFRILDESHIKNVKLKFGLNRFILTVGAIEPRKNLLRLMQAFNMIRNNYPDIVLVHAGPRGWHMDHLMPYIEQQGLSSSVRFIGRVPLSELVGLYNAATLFAYPSLYEGFGLPVLEAMSCGCPVITSNVSSMPEIAGGSTILIDPLQTEEIAGAIQSLISKPDLREILRQKGLQRANCFSWSQCANETIEVYQKVLGITPG
ncbi:MAG TPA: glycosyltransferase family 1 protein [Anaerolineaceae bacterium]|nr:glycosyltransferase family 1 protein [Anaerolineaceae bacterium]